MNDVRFKIPFKVGGIALCLFSILSAPVYAQSLEQAVAQALDTHPDVRQSFGKFKSLEEQVNQASAGYLPTLDLTAGYGYEYTNSPGNRRSQLGKSDGETELRRGEFGLSVRQMLFDGFYTSSDVDRTMFEASAEQWNLLGIAEDLALSVAKSYLNFLKAQQLVALSDKNIASHQEIYEQIKERTDSGLSSIADLSQITGRLARAQSNVVAARNNYRDARVQFKRLTNTEPQDLVMPVPDADMLPQTLETGLSQALAEHPVIKSSQQDTQAARSYKSLVQASYYPTLTLEIDANANNNIRGENGMDSFGRDVGGHSNDVTAMVRFKYNLYAGGKNVSQERDAAYKINQAKEINYRAHRQVTEGMELAWNAYEMLGLQMQYIQLHVEASNDTHVAYVQQFKLGQRSLLDLLDTENELFQARQDYLEAQFSELDARYRLLNATGQLLDSLRITRSKAWQGEHAYQEGIN
ncbi:MAG: TolC family outer membrane protein [Gammaproteobacteria bacterium]|nr:TolC family outer membrane protein [Gammaproteobacteria bacterium]